MAEFGLVSSRSCQRYYYDVYQPGVVLGSTIANALHFVGRYPIQSRIIKVIGIQILSILLSISRRQGTCETLFGHDSTCGGEGERQDSSSMDSGRRGTKLASSITYTQIK
jgi:hypothetical protein